MSDLANLAATTLRFGLMALRENAIFPRLVLQDFGVEEAQKGDVINVPVARAKTAGAVTPGTKTTPQDLDVDNAPITLDQWRTASFKMSDKEKREVLERGILPMNASEGVRALCNELDVYIHTKMRAKCPYIFGTATTAPTAVSDIVGTRKVLNKNLAAKNNRGFVINSDYEASLLNLAAFTSAEQVGSLDGLVEGNLGRKYGFDMAANQNLDSVSITSGTAAGSTITNGAITVGATSVAVDGGTSSTTAVVGDIFTFAGDLQQYVCTATTASMAAGTLAFWPPLKTNVADGVAVTFLYGAGTVVTNYGVAFNQNFFGLVNRAFDPVDPGLGSIVMADQDPVTGLVLRLEVTRVNKETHWEWDMLYGGDVIRPEHGAMLIG